MKVLLYWLLLCLFSPAALAQKTFIQDGKLNGILPLDESGNVAYQVTKTVEGVAKDELFKRGRKWFVSTYSTPKDVIQTNDSSTGELAARGDSHIKSKIQRVTFDGRLSHFMVLEIKDNRYRITLDKIKIDNQEGYIRDYKLPYIATTKNHYTFLYETVNEQMLHLITSLEKALNTSVDF